MAIELHIIAWGSVLLIFNIFAAVHLKTRQYGKDWNIGPRDKEMPPLGDTAARVRRAQDNLLETFPIAIAALLGVVLAGRTSDWTAIGGLIWLGARIVYLPLYWSGVKGWRTLAFLLSLIGLAMVLWPLLWP